MSVQPDWKPSAREKATRTEWERLRAEKLNGPCRGCGGAPEHLHHLVPRAQGGDDVAANLIPLCHACHFCWHDHGTDFRMVAGNIRASLTAQELRYVVDSGKGAVWLEARYPALVEEGLCARCRKPRTPKPRAQRKPRKRYSFLVPNDDGENGADVLDALVDAARGKLGDSLGYGQDTPPYFIHVAALVRLVQD